MPEPTVQYTNQLKKRMPEVGYMLWNDERDIDDQIDDVVMGALLTANRVISGGAVSDGTDLNVDYADAIVRVAGNIYTLTGASLALTGAQPGQELVNWIYVDDAGVITVAIDPPTGDYVPLALVDTSETDVIRIADLRPFAAAVKGIIEHDCINGTFQIAQRGSSQTTDGYGSDDRFSNEHSGSTKVHTREEFTPGQTDVPGNPEYYSKTVVTSVAGAGNYVRKVYRALDVTTYSGKRVCVVFHGKVDTTKNIAVECAQNFGSGGSSEINGIDPQKVELTVSQQKNVLFFDLPSVLGKTIGDLSYTQFTFWFDAGSDFNSRTDTLGQQSGTFEIAEIEIYASDVELPCRRRTEEEELDACVPYSLDIFSIVIGNGFTNLAEALVSVPIPHKMIGIPSIEYDALTDFRIHESGDAIIPTAIVYVDMTENHILLSIVASVSSAYACTFRGISGKRLFLTTEL